MNTTFANIGSLELDTLHLILLGFVLLGATLAVWLWPSRKRSETLSAQINRLYEAESELATANVRLEAAQANLEDERQRGERRIEELEQARRTLQLRLEDSEKNLNAEQVRGEERARAMDEERKQLRELREEVEVRFKEIAHAALKQSQSLFLETANETFGKQKEAAEGNLKSLMSPIREAIGKFETRVEGLEKVRAEDKSAIFEQVRNIGEMLTRNQAVTSKLVTALSSPKGGGRWGEESLRNVMEMAGLSSHSDFVEQHGSAGDGLRPDVIIKMPGGREIVVDSKVSIDDFLQAADEADEARRNTLLAAHARKMKDHVKRLASKEYWKDFESRVDFVAMYVPGENFYAAALQVERDLFDYAARNRVLIVTPSTLIALAKAVAYGWRQEEAAKNAIEAADLGRELYKRLATMTEHVESMGKSLRSTVKSYDKMTASLESRVLTQARRFEDLQISESGGKEIPRIELIDGHGLSSDLADDAEGEDAASTAAE
ncbi:MAG: DNA recombination protein RmuC [Ponticaulis sp.]|nr:DNA recombination protein RmuC [Ponticaulis sp.]|tara:strand:- start:4331 stop:5806 length:1476 start_codon:yes stop_codon:yes gene_type:complete